MPINPALLIAFAFQVADSTSSPTIRGLIDAVGHGSVAAENAFWISVKATGAPIVETVVGEPRLRLVTFVFRGNAETRGASVVALQSDQLANDSFYRLAQLFHVNGTNIWYRTYRMASDVRLSYLIGPDEDRRTRSVLTDAEFARKVETLSTDPLNSRRTQGPEKEESVVELPDAAPQPWITRRDDIQHGTVDSFTVTSKILGNERVVRVYTPPGLKRGEVPAKLVVMLDGEGDPEFFPGTTILDNLIAARKIPPTAAILIHNSPGARVRELWYNADFVQAIAEEIIPAARARHSLPRCPTNCVIAGHSLGGSAAFHAAITRPQLFSGVIAQSGGFMYSEQRTEWSKGQSPDALVPLGLPEGEWLTSQVAATPRLQLRVYLEAGSLENVSYQAGPIPMHPTGTVLAATRHLRDVLIAKGYDLKYNEYPGLHRVLSWRGTFGDAVMFVLARK